MQIRTTESVPVQRLQAQDCDLAEFRSIVEVETDLADWPTAASVDQNVVIYDAPDLANATSNLRSDNAQRAGVFDELADVLVNGPGILMVRGAMDADVIDRVNTVYAAIIAEQRASGGAAGDHFAVAGSNDRIWNSLEKLCLRDPAAFADYHQNEIVDLVCTAFLGPRYQMSSQANQVNPGAAAQEPHRDYHLGFLTDEQAEQFPAHVHRLSPVLTLQGAVAHCDMPIETGPTMYLPHSQKYLHGYLAWRRPEFNAYFKEHFAQLPLMKGDLVFFNPALFHGAGTNQTGNVRRIANLLQVSSAFGRAMERINRPAMVAATYPVLQRWTTDGVSADAVGRVIAAAAEGYAFPNDLDLDQPLDGLAPASMADRVRQALAEGWSQEQLGSTITPS